jgi:hypothetical protein
MRHITKFIKFLTESEEWDKDDLNDFLIPLKHMGLEVRVNDKHTILAGEYEGREITTIRIFLNLDKVELGTSKGSYLYYGTIYDDRIWEILDEVCTLKRRLESDKVFIHLTTAEIQLSYLHGQTDTNTLEFKLKKLKSEIDSRHRSSKSDFANCVTVVVKDDAVIVNCSMAYTRRKWSSLVKGIDFSDWNLDFKENIGRGLYDAAEIIITPKN